MKPLQLSDLSRRESRERAVAWALTITRNTPLAPKHYEQELLEQFVEGQLSIDEIITHLEEGGGSARRVRLDVPSLVENGTVCTVGSV